MFLEEREDFPDGVDLALEVATQRLHGRGRLLVQL